jgi:sulfate permease, SulP family
VPLEPFRVAYHGRKPFRSVRKPLLGTRYLPLVASLRGYSRSRLQTDALAGITVAALALPASMAYADIAGLPVTAGLYSLLLPLVVYALLGSAPWLVVGARKHHRATRRCRAGTPGRGGNRRVHDVGSR